MKKYNLERVTLAVLKNVNKYGKDIRTHEDLHAHRTAMSALPKPVDRESKVFKAYRNEIQKLRKRMKEVSPKRMIFDVYVKQYRRSTHVEYDFYPVAMGPQHIRAMKNMFKEVTDRAIRQVRHEFKDRPGYSPWFGKYGADFSGNKKSGRVFLREGEVLRVYVEKNLGALYTDKRPVELKKYVGIELEFCAPIKENQFAIKLFKSGIHKFAQLKKDGSLRPLDGEVGYELAILLEERNFKKNLKKITDVLKEVKAVAVDRRCGLHVHIDMRKRNKDLVYNNLVACQYALLSVVDPKRFDNEFCRTVDSRKFPTEFTGAREERYKTINAAAFYKYKTIEVRMHEGSVDFNHISNWVDLLVRIGSYSKKIKTNVAKVSTLKRRVPMNKKLSEYMIDRSCYWQVRNTEDTATLRDRVRQMTRITEAQARVAAVNPIPTAQPPQPAMPEFRTTTTATVAAPARPTATVALTAETPRDTFNWDEARRMLGLDEIPPEPDMQIDEPFEDEDDNF